MASSTIFLSVSSLGGHLLVSLLDILASLSGIFRDSFANVVDLLDDMFEVRNNL